MDEALGASRYWCHMCSEIVSPVMDVEVKCPTCQSGFIEEVEASNGRDVNSAINEDAMGSDLGMSLWVPLMLGMIGGGVRPGRRGVRVQLVPRRDGSEESGEEESGGSEDREGESEINDRRRRSATAILETLQGIRDPMASESENSNGERRESEMNDRRRRSAAAILEMLRGIRDQMSSESENLNGESREREREPEPERERRERVILINPFNHTIIVQGSYNSGENHGRGEDETPPIGSMGDYFFGPSLDTLLQHLAENDPNRYGTPPAKKEAIDEMPTVKIQDDVQCSVCLEDFELGFEAKEMPCKHKFHEGCIMPWLELHSSCPVCRHQLPADESKIGASRRENSNTNGDTNLNHGGGEDATAGVRLPIPWPFNALFSFRGSTAPDSGSSDDGGNGGDNSQAGDR